LERVTNKRKSGLYIVLAGPDGSGKSTLADLIVKTAGENSSHVLHLHWRPGVLPRLGSLTGRSEGDIRHPHAKKAHSPIVSTGMVLYYWLDFFLGWWIRIRPARNDNGLVLMERGWWDFAIDPLRYRISVSPSLVVLLGRLLPKPDAVLILEADPETLLQRKQELPAGEIARQSREWRALRLPASVSSKYLDGSRDPETTATDVRNWISSRGTDGHGSPASSETGTDWIRLPRRESPRWMLPRGSRRAARGSLAIYHPVTNRGLIAWKAARGIAGVGGFRLLSGSAELPRPVAEPLGDLLTPGDHVALARANHPARFVALVLDVAGNQKLFAKIAGDAFGRDALEREGETIKKLHPLLPAPLVAPSVISYSNGCLLLQPIRWVARANAWWLAPEVAAAMGAFYARQESNDTSSRFAHGDFAPWNLLNTATGWALIDWESAQPGLPPFYDLWHYVVQSHGLLRKPSMNDISVGLEGRGWVGTAANEYARAAGFSAEDVPAYFGEYLDSSSRLLNLSTLGGRRSLEVRERLRRELRPSI
jgi:thymidylate kinase